MAAVVRALHHAYERPVIFSDPYAGMLAGPLWNRVCRSRLLYVIGTRTIYRPLEPVRRQIVARARYAEDRLEQAVAAGIDQYVIIGAGLDSFAVRRRDLSDRLFVFELDHPATQAAKRQRFSVLNLRLPENHAFVPVDFETESLRDALARSSYDPGRPAFFSWLGTVYYLTETAVFNTLAAIAACACPGSELVFDYAAKNAVMPFSEQKMMRQLARFTRRRREPFVSSFDPEHFPAEVGRLGFALLDSMAPGDQAQTWFPGNDGRMVAMPGSWFVHFRKR